MSVVKTILLSASATALFASLWQAHDRSRRAAEAAQLITANERLRLEASAPASPTNASPQAAPEADPPSPAESSPSAANNVASPPTARLSNYRQAGQATPINALQTYAWACDQADIPRLAQMVIFDPAAREKAAAYRESLPPPVQAQFPTLEIMAAALLSQETFARPYPVAEIMDVAIVEPVSADRVVLRMPGTRHAYTVLQKTSAGWCYVVTEDEVDEYLAEVAHMPPPASRPQP